MPDHATRTPTHQEQLETEKERFWEEIGEAPPGDRPLAVQILGWALILQGGAVALVLLDSAIGTTWFRIDILLRGFGAAILVATGILVDRANPWGFWTGLAVSLAGAGLLARAYLAGSGLLAGIGALWDAGILLGLLVARDRFFEGRGPTG